MNRRFICIILLRLFLPETMARYRIHEKKKYLMVLSTSFIHISPGFIFYLGCSIPDRLNVDPIPFFWFHFHHVKHL